MVSADNLHLDVLELIFAYLDERDLLWVALVSRSFFSGVVPRLYGNLLFHLRQMKRFPKVSTPFATLIAHPDLAVHVRTIDIRVIPVIRSTRNRHPGFVQECVRAISLCRNLRSFKCTVDILPSVLPSLKDKPRLENLWIRTDLNAISTVELVDTMTGIKDLSLEFGNWRVVDVLPRWTDRLSKTLTTLTLYMCAELNSSVLESALSHLPKLEGLHVVGCARVDHVEVLRLAGKTPRLQSLAFTAQDTNALLPDPVPLSNLQHLAIDTRQSGFPSTSPTVLTSILSFIRYSSPALTSFAIKFPERKSAIDFPFLQQLLESQGHSLTMLTFMDCTVGKDSIAAICRSCVQLERLVLPISFDQMVSFTDALGRSSTLHTLLDGDSHTMHGPRPSLTKSYVKYLMKHVRCLRTIVSEGRVWTGHTQPSGELTLEFEHRRTPFSKNHWFMPRDPSSY